MLCGPKRSRKVIRRQSAQGSRHGRSNSQNAWRIDYIHSWHREPKVADTRRIGSVEYADSPTGLRS